MPPSVAGNTSSPLAFTVSPIKPPLLMTVTMALADVAGTPAMKSLASTRRTPPVSGMASLSATNRITGGAITTVATALAQVDVLGASAQIRYPTLYVPDAEAGTRIAAVASIDNPDSPPVLIMTVVTLVLVAGAPL